MEAAALGARRRHISAATWLESAMVVDGRSDPVVSRRLDDIVRTLVIEVVPVTPAHAVIARRAFADFRKGRHPAGLMLLCKGNDFRLTDIQIVELSDGSD